MQNIVTELSSNQIDHGCFPKPHGLCAELPDFVAVEFIGNKADSAGKVCPITACH